MLPGHDVECLYQRGYDTICLEKLSKLKQTIKIYTMNSRSITTLKLCINFTGISGKSQILFAIVYTTRYLDLVTTYVSLYNTLMKVVFIVASYATVHLIYMKFKATYDHNHDTFRMEFLLGPAVILALLINHDFTPLEVRTN